MSKYTRLLSSSVQSGEEVLEGTGRIGRCATGGSVELGPGPPNLPLHSTAPQPLPLLLQNLPDCRAGRRSPLQPDVVQPASSVSSTSASCSACPGLCCSGPWSKQVSQVHTISPSATASRECEWHCLCWTRVTAELRRPGSIFSQNAGGRHLLRWPLTGISSEWLPMEAAGGALKDSTPALLPVVNHRPPWAVGVASQC